MVTINAAESNRASVRYIKESNWATTPASGVTKEMRLTSSSLTASKDTVVSEEIRADRMIPNIIEVAASSGGDINFEFSSGTVDEFFEAFLLGTWTTPNSTINHEFGFVKGGITVTSDSVLTVTGVDLTTKFSVNDYVKLEGMVLAGNNKYAQLVGVSATTLTFAGSTFTTTDETNNTTDLARRVIHEANDVIAVSTNIRFGTGGASSIDSNGNNDFINAELSVGQRIYIDGLGYGTQTVTFSTNPPADGDLITVSDGTTAITFEVDNNSTFTAGNIPFAPGANVTEAAENFRDAVMKAFGDGLIRVSATNSAGVATLTNLRDDAGALSETGADIAVGGATFTGLDDTQHGFYEVTAFDNDSISLDRAPTTDANAGSATVIVKGSHLRNPGDINNIIKQSFSIETGFNDVNKHFLQTGMRVGSFNMSVTSGEIVNGSFSFQGKETSTNLSTVLGNTGTYTVQGTTETEIYNATSNVAELFKDGTTLSTAIQSIEINGENSLREQRAVSEKFPAGIGYGRFSLSGTLTAYFETLDLFNEFLNHTTVSLAFNFQDVDNNSYWFTIPALKITADPIAPGGIDQDILEEMEWSAQRDPGSNTQFMIDRFSSILPVGR